MALAGGRSSAYCLLSLWYCSLLFLVMNKPEKSCPACASQSPRSPISPHLFFFLLQGEVKVNQHNLSTTTIYLRYYQSSTSPLSHNTSGNIPCYSPLQTVDGIVYSLQQAANYLTAANQPCFLLLHHPSNSSSQQSFLFAIW